MMYLKASADVENLNFFGEKWGDEAVDHITSAKME